MLQYLQTTSAIPTNPIRWSARAITLRLLSLSILLSVSLGFTATRPTNAAPIESNTESQLVEATNAQRIENDLAPLTWNADLYAAATAKASNMLQQQYFDHIAPDGTTPWSFIRKNYSYESAGENLAIDFRNPIDAVPAWMNSPTHRANILDPKFSDTGIVIVRGTLHGKQATIIVQMFGEPSNNPLNLTALNQR
jgi:uncharacterized protein YkwD